MSTISFVVPTIGRPSLQATVNSVERWAGDELLVVKHDPPGGNWGNAERQHGQDIAKCDYLAFIDDDDVYVPGHRQLMATAIREAPGKPIIFRIQYPNGKRLWQPSKFADRPPQIKNGNVSSQMFLFPNDKTKLARWLQVPTWRGRASDFYFASSTGWGNRCGFAWREEVLVLMGHDDPYIFVHNTGRLREEVV